MNHHRKMRIDLANKETFIIKKYESVLQSKEEEYLDRINELRGLINQMKVDHRKEVMDLLASREAIQAQAENRLRGR